MNNKTVWCITGICSPIYPRSPKGRSTSQFPRVTVPQLSLSVTECLRIATQRRKRLFKLTVSEVSVHGYLALLLLGPWWGKIWQRARGRAKLLVVVIRKQRDSKGPEGTPFTDRPHLAPFPSSLQPWTHRWSQQPLPLASEHCGIRNQAFNSWVFGKHFEFKPQQQSVVQYHFCDILEKTELWGQRAGMWQVWLEGLLGEGIRSMAHRALHMLKLWNLAKLVSWLW